MSLFSHSKTHVENENYKLGLKYEFGKDTKRDYQKALKYYEMAAMDGHLGAKQKLRYVQYDKVSIFVTLLVLLVTLVIGLYYNQIWFPFFATGLSITIFSIFHFKSYWIKDGYAHKLNLVLFFCAILLLLPLSSILPYLFGVTTLSLTLLNIISFFILFAGTVIYFSEKEFRNLMVIITGFIVLIISIVPYFIETNDKVFMFKNVDGGVEIIGLKIQKEITNIPSRLNNKPVVSIGKDAFRGQNIRDVYIPDSVLTIKEYAFYNSSLETIRLPEHVKLSTGVFAFTNLETITLPNNLDSIPDRLFYGAIYLDELTIPATVKSIGKEAFYYTLSLDQLTLPEELESIDDYAFAASAIESLIIPESVTLLGKGLFENNYHIHFVKFPNNLNILPERTFKGTKSLGDYQVPNHIHAIEAYAFEDATLSSITFHDDIINIGKGAFKDVKGLVEVQLPPLLTRLEDELFRNNISLVNIELPDNLEQIGSRVFMDAQSLESIHLPNKVESLGASVFENAVQLKNINLPNSITKIGVRTFYNNISLTQIDLPDQLTEISDHLFYGAINLESVLFPNTITRIGKEAFRGNTKFVHIQLPNSVEIIDDNAFALNINLESIDLGTNIKVIGTGAFLSDTKLKSISNLSGVERISDLAFANTSALESVILSTEIDVVGYNAFMGNHSLSITIYGNYIPQNWSSSWNPNNRDVTFIE